jgi:hypothetical protein
MKKYIFIASLFLTNLLYSSAGTYQIIDSVTVDTNGCKYHYPILVSNAPDSCFKKVNKFLREYSKMIFGDGFRKYEYSILFDSDSLLCFEFRVKYDQKITLYSSVCIDPSKAQVVLPLPYLDRKKLYPFVVKYFNEASSDAYGSKAYHYGGGGYANLIYGITKSNLVLYIGGEGELYGDDRLEIPFKKLGCDIYKMNEVEIENHMRKYDPEIIPANYGSLLLID